MTLFKKAQILAKECFKKRSLIRTLHNIYLFEKSFEGNGIDFGAKNASGSYYHFLNLNNAKMTYVDIDSNSLTNIRTVDLEKDFDIGEDKYDFALLMNVLEHIYNYDILLVNINKSLRDGAYLEGFVPFLYQYHADPDDFFRYTHTGLLRILEDSGFVNVKVTKIGVGMFVAIASMSSRLLIFRLLVYIWWLLALFINMILSKIWKKNMFFYAGLAFSAVKKASNNI